ncbi:MAG TPA: DMT family transporter [Thermomicrobiales bacterium]|nr:DMT family transporter [Thermomicrobiales bacterium]
MIFQRYPILIHLSLLLTAVIWGATFVAVKYVVEQVGPAGVVLLRVGLSSACFVALLGFTWRTIPRMPAAVWRQLALIAVCGSVVNNLAIAWGQSYLAAALASLIVTSNPIFTTIISRLLLGEPLTRRKLSGIAVAFSGFMIVLLYGGSEARFSIDNAVGILILICAPLGWATYTVLSKPLLQEYEPHVVAGLTTILGAVMLSPLLVFNADIVAQAAAFSWKSWLAAITMSVLAVFVAYILWYRGLRGLEPTQVAVYVYLVPFFGVLFAWLLLGETITRYLLLGGATILTGVIVTNSGRRPPAEPLDGENQRLPRGRV